MEGFDESQDSSTPNEEETRSLELGRNATSRMQPIAWAVPGRLDRHQDNAPVPLDEGLHDGDFLKLISSCPAAEYSYWLVRSRIL